MSSSGTEVDLGQRDDLLLVEESSAVILKFLAYGVIGGSRIVLRGIDEMQQYSAALDMAEKTMAEPGLRMRP